MDIPWPYYVNAVVQFQEATWLQRWYIVCFWILYIMSYLPQTLVCNVNPWLLYKVRFYTIITTVFQFLCLIASVFNLTSSVFNHGKLKSRIVANSSWGISKRKLISHDVKSSSESLWTAAVKRCYPSRVTLELQRFQISWNIIFCCKSFILLL